jgi:hypothetical protein
MHLFIDTNVLLSFFHYADDDLEELNKLVGLVARGGVTLHLPEQVKQEFHRNRDSKIADAVKTPRKHKFGISFPVFCRSYPEFRELVSLIRDCQRKHEDLFEKVDLDISGKSLKADKLVSELFEKGELHEISKAIIGAARLRVELGNPPGKGGSIGDAVNWETLLAEVPNAADIHFVTSDGDYSSPLNNSDFDQFLLGEWKGRKTSNIFFYNRLSDFFGKHFSQIKLAQELEKEALIGRLATAANFAGTHEIIGKLQRSGDFTDEQVEKILRIALENTQVRWIIADDDVKIFLGSLIDGRKDKIPTDLLNEILPLFEEIEEEA